MLLNQDRTGDGFQGSSMNKLTKACDISVNFQYTSNTN